MLTYRQDQRMIRSLIRKADKKTLTRTQQDVLTKIVNLWFYHQNKDGFIRPGLELIAKACRCTARSVSTALSKLRALNIIKPIKYAKGGRLATRYVVDTDAITDLFLPSNIVHAEGELVQFHAAEESVSRNAASCENHEKISNGIDNIEDRTSPECDKPASNMHKDEVEGHEGAWWRQVMADFVAPKAQKIKNPFIPGKGFVHSSQMNAVDWVHARNFYRGVGA